MAYSLQSSLPSMQFSMVAEEDSADLRSLHTYCSLVVKKRLTHPSAVGVEYAA